MPEMVQIRSWKAFWNDYVVEGLKDKADTKTIHDNIVEAMRKEVFGQLMFRCNVVDIKDIQENDKNAKIIESVAKNTLDKLHALIRACRKYVETKDILDENDFNAMCPAVKAEEEEDDGLEVDERTAEWPELSE